MSKTKKEIIVENPKQQLKLYGFENYFKLFAQLFLNNNLPKVSMITGPKGIGKATFIYHFINFILSQNEENSYSLEKNEINTNNKSFQLLNSGLHPNFFSIKAIL